MNSMIAALPMYDWPECRRETDAQWQVLRDALRAQGVEAPDALTRGGDLHALWRHPHLLLAQTCWGPLKAGLADHVRVVGQSDYSDCEGGEGPYYSSAIVMRAEMAGQAIAAPEDGRACLPLHLMRGRRFAFNETLSLSGFLALNQDLKDVGEDIDFFTGNLETGGHRSSLKAVRDGQADFCAIDCRSWAMAQRFEPAAEELRVVGWTARRLGLPYITCAHSTDILIEKMRIAISSLHRKPVRF